MRPYISLLIVVLIFGAIGIASFFVVAKQHSHIALSPTPTASSSPEATEKPKNELSKEDQKLWDSFCGEVKDSKVEGIYYSTSEPGEFAGNITDWKTWRWCFTQDGTRTATLAMEKGILGRLEISYSPKSYLEVVYSKSIRSGVGIDTNIQTPSEDDLKDNGFNNCPWNSDLTANYKTQHFNGWYMHMCGWKYHPGDPRASLSNLKGSYAEFFDYIGKIVLWDRNHLPKFSDFPATQIKESNFAGHYEIKTGYCRPECSAYIKDITTGKDFDPIRTEGFNFDFHSDSNLVIAEGFRETSTEPVVKIYYLWKDNALELLYKDYNNCSPDNIEGDFIKSVTDDNLKKLIVNSLNTIYLSNLKDLKLTPNPTNSYCKVSFEGTKADLNNDGSSEYVVTPQQFYDEKNGLTDFGVHANAPILIFSIQNGQWTKIGEMRGQLLSKITSRQSQGYPNLVTFSADSAISGTYDEYAWNGKIYKLINEITTDITENGNDRQPYHDYRYADPIWGW